MSSPAEEAAFSHDSSDLSFRTAVRKSLKAPFHDEMKEIPPFTPSFSSEERNSSEISFFGSLTEAKTKSLSIKTARAITDESMMGYIMNPPFSISSVIFSS